MMIGSAKGQLSRAWVEAIILLKLQGPLTLAEVGRLAREYQPIEYIVRIS